MEKIKSHIHMEQIKCAQSMQFVIEEDKNINDQSPDIAKLLLEEGEVVVDEIYPGTNFVQIRGRLRYQILYLTKEKDRKLHKITGEVGWEEKIHMEGTEPTDVVTVKKQVEDMKVSCSNLRKINIKMLVSLEVAVKELCDEEIISGLEREGMELRKKKMVLSNLAVKKKDSILMKEETELPKTLPSIEQVLWKSLEINKWEIKPLEDNIVVGWEATMFVLYRCMGEEEEIKSFEATLKHNTNLECPGSHPSMLESSRPAIQSYGINVKQDQDGEDRILEAEVLFDLDVLLYEDKEVEMITDVYGIREDISPIYRKGTVKIQGEKQQIKLRLNKVIRTPASYPGILQICHVKAGEIYPEQIRKEEGEGIQGSIPLRILYLSEKEEEAYCSIREEIGFYHQLEREKEKVEYTVYGVVQQCNTVLLDSEEIELRLTLLLELQRTRTEERDYLEDIEVKELLPQMRKELPSMAVYRAMEDEELWEIGKRYFVPIENIKRINQMENDLIKGGQKILLVR